MANKLKFVCFKMCVSLNSLNIKTIFVNFNNYEPNIDFVSTFSVSLILVSTVVFTIAAFSGIYVYKMYLNRKKSYIFVSSFINQFK